MNNKNEIEKNSIKNNTVFKIKSSIHIFNRKINNLIYPTKRFKNKNLLDKHSVIAFSESDLWNPNDNEQNWILTAGKIENIRIASNKLNGIEIGANEVFSFWRHIGNPNFGKGYVVGREIREGCVIPTIAGGLCQLSNALYDTALKANFDIIERHKHTKVIKGSLAEKDRDATVKWNYVDLRFKSNFDFKIEAELTSEKLIISFKSIKKNTTKDNQNSLKFRQSNKLNDCYSCGNYSCPKHEKKDYIDIETTKTTFILDEKWPEFDKYINDKSKKDDFYIVPLKKNLLIKTNRYSWKSLNKTSSKALFFSGIYRALRLRLFSSNKNNVFELSLKLDRYISINASKHIPIESKHLVVSQNLLPFLYESGALGGRTYDVLMTRLPIELLHKKLNAAFLKHPNSKTLNDYRAPNHIISLENKALTQARKIITPHNEIGEIFKHKVEKLNWYYPKNKKIDKSGTKILFPASSIGRKGVYSIKKLCQDLNLRLTISGKKNETKDFWDSIETEIFSGDFNEIGLVIYPAYVENQPRSLLKAISLNIPVITSFEAGIKESENVKVIDVNDYNSLKKEVINIRTIINQ
ncbi:MAG: hypothetical protein CL846_02495 [Crocinitomicaceae bacterium]|nr:hypothetical protein [Crocinitomicaceae bacterium]